jgi:hypothetical protein
VIVPQTQTSEPVHDWVPAECGSTTARDSEQVVTVLSTDHGSGVIRRDESDCQTYRVPPIRLLGVQTIDVRLQFLSHGLAPH